MPIERLGFIAIRKDNGGTYVFSFDQSSLARTVAAIDDVAADDELDFDMDDANEAVLMLDGYVYSDYWSDP